MGGIFLEYELENNQIWVNMGASGRIGQPPPKKTHISGRETNKHGHILVQDVLWMSPNKPRRHVFQFFFGSGASRQQKKPPQLFPSSLTPFNSTAGWHWGVPQHAG